MRDITKNRWKKLIYVLIVIGAFWLGHQYGEEAARFANEMPIPKDELDILEEELAVPEATEEVRG